MRSLFTSRLFRCVVCLLLICCVLVQISPLKVRATSAVVPIVKAATVTGNPYVIVGAALIALGVMVGTETGAFETVVDNAVSFLDTAGGWIENGTMQLLQTVDSTGQAMYYAAGDLFETLRSWCFESSTLLTNESVIVPDSITSSRFQNAFESASAAPYALFSYFISKPANDWVIYWSDSPLTYKLASDGNLYTVYCTDGGTFSYQNSSRSESGLTTSGIGNGCAVPQLFGTLGTGSITSSLDLSLGVVPTVPIDGTSAREWAPDYANKGLKVIEGGGGTDPDNDGSDGKWFLPLALTVTAAELYLMSQADEWSAVTPPEFADNVSTSTEFEILSTPEIDGYQGIEIQPVQDPAPDTGGDSGETPDPTTGGDPGSDPDTGGSSNPDAGQDPDTNPDTNPDADPDGGDSGDSGDGGSQGSFSSSGSPSGGNFQVDLRNFFPFCIPFDLHKMLSALVAEPIAPVFTFAIPTFDDIYYLEIDLSAWNGVAATVRTCQVALFCVGLVVATRKFIKW